MSSTFGFLSIFFFFFFFGWCKGVCLKIILNFSTSRNFPFSTLFFFFLSLYVEILASYYLKYLSTHSYVFLDLQEYDFFSVLLLLLPSFTWLDFPQNHYPWLKFLAVFFLMLMRSSKILKRRYFIYDNMSSLLHQRTKLQEKE